MIAAALRALLFRLAPKPSRVPRPGEPCDRCGRPEAARAELDRWLDCSCSDEHPPCDECAAFMLAKCWSRDAPQCHRGM